MSHEPVHVFDVGHPDGADGPVDQSGRGGPATNTSGGDRAPRDRSDSDGAANHGPAPDRIGRSSARPVRTGLAMIAALGAVVALLGAVGLWRYRARTVTTVRIVAAGAPVTVDATGCPVTDRCRIDAGWRLYAAVRAWDPSASLLTATDLDSAAGAPLRATLVVETSVTFANGSPLERARSVLTVVAQCVPGGAQVSSSVRVEPGLRVQVVTVAGRPGCSVTVTSEAEDGVPVPIDSLDDLAHRPSLQI